MNIHVHVAYDVYVDRANTSANGTISSLLMHRNKAKGAYRSTYFHWMWCIDESAVVQSFQRC